MGFVEKLKGMIFFKKHSFMVSEPVLKKFKLDLAAHNSTWSPYQRCGISAFSILLPKQVQFALFKLPWLVALIESLLLDSRPSRQLKAGPQQCMRAGGGGKCPSLCYVKYECGISTGAACSTWKFDSLNIKSTSWAQGKLSARWRLYLCNMVMETLWRCKKRPASQQLERG